ncbi:hypothetical protein GCM10009555_017940 [Acrocarpospora macrocephala]|uniref:DNA primase/polymerase bifunctional N-terminal domain-containing protein n=1 Tax=Acrocarpospora macrocephala TaxID=150177 RepID=A0A5M3WEQ0_9ACTN|nr:bifunctional DNA primase/polymerase [Acrocarpospora macrocephala]GES07454.1 hypothetical protein Amac_010490 [Acrocarpospora macrocephala]
MTPLRDTARQAHANGLCLIPAATNGTKQPWPDGASWKRYETARPTPDQLDRWFANGRYDGLGVVCGRISGNLEMLEFEGRAITEGLVKEIGIIANDSGLDDLWARVANGYRETTPSGGVHLLYRVGGPVSKNTKLARRPSTPEELAAWKAQQQADIDKERDRKRKAKRQEKLDQVIRGEQVPQVLIETRGEGGFVVIAPSAGRTHASGRGWALTAGGFDTIPTITPEERDALHRLAAALDQMPAAREEPTQAYTRTARAEGAARDGLRPGDDFNNRTTWDEILISIGWTKTCTRGSVTYWRRAGKDRGVSATTGRNGADNLYVFSTSTVFEAEVPYSKFAAHTLLTEGTVTPATLSAAAKQLYAQGYGTQRSPRPVASSHADLPPHPADDQAYEPDEGDEDDEPDDADWEKGPVRRRGMLPEDFWAARPVLQHIRQAAHARSRSGDIVLGGLLARLSSLLPPELKADTGVGSPASANLFVILLGPSGSGKSSAAWIPRQLLPPPLLLDFLDELPLGSGEGIAEAYMGEREQATGEMFISGPRRGTQKTERVRMQVRHNALFYADEGESFTKQLFGRNGTTVGESIRRAWTGGTIGQFNGNKINTRVIESGSYSLGLVVGFQPETALPLLEDVAAGTPQRFLWVSSTDPSIPEEIVEDPGPLNLTLVRHGFGTNPRVRFAPTLVKAIREEDRARATGAVKLPPLDSHRPLMLVKLSVLLAILENRLNVTEDDWELATIMWRTSCELRDYLLEYGARQIAEDAEKKTRAHIEREVRAHTAKAATEHDVERVARRVAKRVRDAGSMTRGALNKDTASRDRGCLAMAVTLAEARGWLAVEGDALTPGDSMPA